MCLPTVSSFSKNINTTDIFRTSYIAENLKNNMPAKPLPAKRQKSSTDKTKKLLPEDFEPSEYSVICGNKRAFFNSVGNRRFRVICQMHLSEYMNAPSKHEKSFVVTKVMKALRDACPVGAFVAFEKGRWWEVSDRTSREKVGTFFRDCLADSYKSSSKNKIAQRRKKRTMYGPMDDDSDRCASPVPSASVIRSVSPVPSGIPRAVTITPPRAPRRSISLPKDIDIDVNTITPPPAPRTSISLPKVTPTRASVSLASLFLPLEMNFEMIDNDDGSLAPLPLDQEPSFIPLETEEAATPFVEPAPVEEVQIPAPTPLEDLDDASSVGSSSAASVNPVDEFIYNFFD